MFNIPAITWILTVVLLLSGGYHLLQAIQSDQLKDQINNCLHTLMQVLMTAMLWHLGSSIMLAQIAVLAGAALWFILQAAARPEVKMLCTDSRGRLKCIYHSLTMIGAAIMVAMMGKMTIQGYELVPTGEKSMSHDHHAMTTPIQVTPMASFDQSSNLALLLTVFFGAAAVVFVILLLRFQGTKTTHHSIAALKISARSDHALEALGAAVMALMFATMMV